MDEPTQSPPVDIFAGVPPTDQPRRLYSPTQIRVAVVLGTPLAGGWMLGQNRRALGQPGFWGELGKAIAVLVALLLISLPFPKTNFRFGEIGLIAYSYWAGLHKKTYNDLVSQGAQRQSNWRVLLVAVLSIVAFFVVLLPFAPLLPDDPDEATSTPTPTAAIDAGAARPVSPKAAKGP